MRMIRKTFLNDKHDYKQHKNTDIGPLWGDVFDNTNYFELQYQPTIGTNFYTLKTDWSIKKPQETHPPSSN